VAASLMLAIWRRAPANIERYLWAVLVYIPFVWWGHYWYGDWAWQYAAIYSLFTGVILWCVCRITLDCLRERHYRARAVAITLITALMLARLSYMGTARPLGAWAWISLSEGFVLAWAGTLTAFLAPYMRRPDLIFPLAVFWLAQAGYSFGWTLNWKEWQEANWLVPPALGTCCFSWLAYRLRAVPREA